MPGCPLIQKRGWCCCKERRRVLDRGFYFLLVMTVGLVLLLHLYAGDHCLLWTSQCKEIHIIEISLYRKSIHVLLNLWNVVFNAVSSINEISATSAVLMKQKQISDSAHESKVPAWMEGEKMCFCRTLQEAVTLNKGCSYIFSINCWVLFRKWWKCWTSNV